MWEIPEVRERVKASKLYMIAQREEVFFRDVQVDEKSLQLSFSLSNSSVRMEGLSVDLAAVAGTEKFFLEGGPKFFRLWEEEQGQKGQVIDWFTVEKLLFDHWHGRVEVKGLKRYGPFTTFQLLYVGISKEDDSFSRLFQNGHQKRAKILSNETQLRPDARVTDELFIFLFDVAQTHIKTISWEEDVTPLLEEAAVEKVRLVADAEKAFVRLLDTQYNTIKYKAYPKGSDGLYGSGLNSYAYLIDEDLTFATPSALFRGAHVNDMSGPKDRDLVLVSGDQVTLMAFDDS